MEIPSSSIANWMLGTSQVAVVFKGTLQVWKHEVVSVLGNATSIVLKSYFTPEVWASSTPKRVVVPSGVEIGATNATYAIATTYSADGQAGSFGGTLTLEVQGTISGIGGAPNSGVGGGAIWANYPGKDGQQLVINNHGTIRSGGGGGGAGGNGGPGYYQTPYTYTEGPYFNNNNPGYGWVDFGGTSSHSMRWGPYYVYPTSHPRSDGGWVYRRGNFHSNIGGYNNYYIYRQQTRYNTYYTSGGAGGAGGRGQGYDGANAGGSAGGAGGTNAGAGGTGGTGGGWGATGGTGNTGASGNNGGGAAGAAGGLAGFYLNGTAYATLNNYGTVQGRLN